MVPSDFAGIFSRYFVIGFFLPVFFALMLVAHLVAPSSTPTAYATAEGGTQVLILGGVGLLGGLLLLGINQYVIRIFAGYPMQRLLAALAGRLDPGRRTTGILLWYFPWRSEEVMPTKLGNVIRAFESYPFKTYGLDGPPNWSGSKR